MAAIIVAPFNAPGKFLPKSVSGRLRILRATTGAGYDSDHPSIITSSRQSSLQQSYYRLLVIILKSYPQLLFNFRPLSGAILLAALKIILLLKSAQFEPAYLMLFVISSIQFLSETIKCPQSLRLLSEKLPLPRALKGCRIFWQSAAPLCPS